MDLSFDTIIKKTKFRGNGGAMSKKSGNLKKERCKLFITYKGQTKRLKLNRRPHFKSWLFDTDGKPMKIQKFASNKKPILKSRVMNGFIKNRRTVGGKIQKPGLKMSVKKQQKSLKKSLKPKTKSEDKEKDKDLDEYMNKKGFTSFCLTPTRKESKKLELDEYMSKKGFTSFCLTP